EPGQDAQGGGLAGAVGAEEPGHGAGRAREGEVIDGDARAVALGQAAHVEGCGGSGRFGHGSTVRRAGRCPESTGGLTGARRSSGLRTRGSRPPAREGGRQGAVTVTTWMNSGGP